MNNIEQYQQIIGDAYENYLEKTMFDDNPKWLESIPVMNMRTGEKSIGARQYAKVKFIEKIKTDSEFARQWDVQIETRELSNEEIAFGVNKRGVNLKGMTFSGKLLIDPKEIKEKNLPTKLITVTYNDKTVEVYE